MRKHNHVSYYTLIIIPSDPDSYAYYLAMERV